MIATDSNRKNISNIFLTMTDYQHQLDVMIAETLEKLQPLSPDRYALHYTELYTHQRNWNVTKLHQIEQDLITYAK